MSTLILSLPTAAPTADAEWRYVLSDDGQHVARSGSCGAPLLPAPGRTGETVAVVPARQVSWQRLTLPHGALSQTQRLRAVLSGLLEEQLLDEPERLHFALPPGAATGEPIWVAVCDRAWLRACLQLLEAAGHRVDRIVPACAPGATASGQLEGTVIGTPDEATLVLTGVGEAQAVSLLPLQAQMATGLLTPDTPLRAEPAVAELAERRLGRPVALQSLDDGLLQATRGPWDLAQFDLASNGGQRALRWLGTSANTLWRAPEWRAARWAIGLLVVVQIAALNLWSWQDGRTLARQQAAVRGVLTQTFPQVKLVVDAPVQMNKEVALLRQQTGALSASDLESLMAAAARQLPADSVPGRIEFSDGRLRLAGLTLTAEQQEALRQQLAGQALTLESEDGALVLRANAGMP